MQNDTSIEGFEQIPDDLACFGHAFIEVVRHPSSGKVVKLGRIPPFTMFEGLLRDRSGAKQYVQVVEGKTVATFEPGEILKVTR